MKGHKDFVFINNDFSKWQQDIVNDDDYILYEHNQKKMNKYLIVINNIIFLPIYICCDFMVMLC